MRRYAIRTMGYQIPNSKMNRDPPIKEDDRNRINSMEYTWDFNSKNVDLKMKSFNKDSTIIGGGFDLQSIGNALRMVEKVGKKALDVYTGPAGTYIKNTYGQMMNKNPKWAPSYPGEAHLINSRGVSYNFCGPGTNLEARLARGDVGINKLDECCKVENMGLCLC